MSPQLNEEQILEALSRFSPMGRRKILRKLIVNFEEIDRILHR